MLGGVTKLVSMLLLALVLVAAGCGSDETTTTPARTPVPGTTISGPGLQRGKPPWRPEYAHLRERLRERELPPAGTERFHIHALLHIYVDGLLSPVPTDIGIKERLGIESSVHTHDGTGIIHMEATRPHKFTLGDFFAVWGVALGPDRVGGLTGLGGNRLHFYLNGRPLRDPAAHVLRDHDNIAIGYGADDSFPHTPSTELFRTLEGKGGGALSCTKLGKDGRRTRRCFSPKRKR